MTFHDNNIHIRPCFIDSLFPVTRPHPFQAAAPKIIIELACYESH